MPLLQRLTEGAVLVARQATDTATATVSAAATISAAIAAATTAAEASASGSVDGALGSGTAVGSDTQVPTYTSGNVTNSGTSSSSTNSGNTNTGSSSPLLFFVALGFGVVFTNLWIIVGVKYCFRYNARARAMRQAQEDGEPINLEIMPRPHRRRREKKLMAIDEVNEKFPMMKYKSWVASRERQGLSTRGGVDAPTRANSVRSADGVTVQHKERDSTDEAEETKHVSTAAIATVPTASSADADADTNIAAMPSKETDVPESKEDTTTTAAAGTAAAATSEDTNGEPVNSVRDSYHHSEDEDEEHDEHGEHMIDAALPPECIGTSGDTCAICIDTLEDDDDVRGLTCGHAFHAVCLDPWLTSRRACCPLCKADYYTPKPRPPPLDGAEPQIPVIIAAVSHSEPRRQRTANSRPGSSWSLFRSLTRTPTSGTGLVRQTRGARGARGTQSAQSTQSSQSERTRPGLFALRWPGTSGTSGTQSGTTANSSPSNSSRGNWLSNIRPSIPGFRNAARRQGQTEATPSQLEAGVRHG